MANAVTVELKGVSQVNANLGSLRSGATTYLESAINKGIALVDGRAKYRCPADTGRLRNSIHMRKAEVVNNEVVGVVYTALEYAAYVEFGTGRRGGYPYQTSVALSYNQNWAGMVAQPYLMPALLESKSEIKSFVSQAVTQAARRVSK